MKADVIIVNFFKAEEIVKSISRLERLKGFYEFNFIIWDNSVCRKNWKILTESLDKLNNVALINSPQNIGYTRAYNRAIEKTTTNTYIIQNPDIQVENILDYENLVKIVKHDEKIGIVGCKQINHDGSVPSIVRNFPSAIGQIVKRSSFLQKNKFFKKSLTKYENNEFDYSKKRYVPWIQSSFFVVSRATWESLCGFDERFFIFMSDIDICLRCWLSGKRVLYTPEVMIRADGRRSSEGPLFDIFFKRVLAIHALDAIRYYTKYCFIKNARKEIVQIEKNIEILNHNE